MDVESLKARKVELEKEFEVCQKRVQSLNEHMVMLRGSYSEIIKLIPPDPQPEIVDANPVS
jgi:hypothetical protein